MPQEAATAAHSRARDYRDYVPVTEQIARKLVRLYPDLHLVESSGTKYVHYFRQNNFCRKSRCPHARLEGSNEQHLTSHPQYLNSDQPVSAPMPPGGGRFAPQILTNNYPQLHHASVQHMASQHQAPGSASLPPPAFNNHPGFPQTSQNSNTNALAMNGTNGLAPGFRGGSSLGGGGTGLGSHAAVMAFGHGAAMQQQQQHRETLRRGSGASKSQSRSRIRDVWKGNLAQEMAALRDLIDKYPYISMVSTPFHDHRCVESDGMATDAL